MIPDRGYDITFGLFISALQRLGCMQAPIQEDRSGEWEWFRIVGKTILHTHVGSFPDDTRLPVPFISEICDALGIGPDDFYGAVDAILGS